MDNLTSLILSSLLHIKQRRTSARVGAASLDWADPSTFQFPQRIDSDLDADILHQRADCIDKRRWVETCGTLGEGEGAGAGEWDVVMGADVVWLEGLVPLLVGALDRLCGPRTLLLLAHQKRSEITDYLLFSTLSNYFIIEEVQHPPVHPPC